MVRIVYLKIMLRCANTNPIRAMIAMIPPKVRVENNRPDDIFPANNFPARNAISSSYRRCAVAGCVGW